MLRLLALTCVLGVALATSVGDYQIAFFKDIDTCKAAVLAGTVLDAAVGPFKADDSCQTASTVWPGTVQPLARVNNTPGTPGVGISGILTTRIADPAGSFSGSCSQSTEDVTDLNGITKFSGKFYLNAFISAADAMGFKLAGQCNERTAAQYTAFPSQYADSKSYFPAAPTVAVLAATMQTQVCTQFFGSQITKAQSPGELPASLPANLFTFTPEPVCTGAPLVEGGRNQPPCTQVPEAPLGVVYISCNFPKSSSVCFPATAAVQLEDGSAVRMDALQVGQKVRVGAKEHSEVFMFSHTYTDAQATFVQLKTATGSIQLTEGHYIYANGKAVPAGTVKVGDLLETATGAPSAVTGISTVRATGLYNPHTLNGDIVVNGFRTTTYTDAINPTLAHAMLAPARAMYAMNITLA